MRRFSPLTAAALLGAAMLPDRRFTVLDRFARTTAAGPGPVGGYLKRPRLSHKQRARIEAKKRKRHA